MRVLVFLNKSLLRPFDVSKASGRIANSVDLEKKTKNKKNPKNYVACSSLSVETLRVNPKVVLEFHNQSVLVLLSVRLYVPFISMESLIHIFFSFV